MKDALWRTFIIVCFLNAVALIIATVWVAMVTTWDTGPGCPGDPTWLGFCSEVDSQ